LVATLTTILGHVTVSVVDAPFTDDNRFISMSSFKHVVYVIVVDDAEYNGVGDA
jgi:hypothetical protein